MRLETSLGGYVPQSEDEGRDLERLRRLAAESGDPWTRASALHVTGSAVVVHPPTRRVLLRWHERMQAWLQVGGHADPGEVDPFVIALREAREETGLGDLVAWPDPRTPRIVQVAVVPVPAGRGEAAHEHGDIRYALATAAPDLVVPESASALLTWLTIEDALERVAWDNLRICLERIAALMNA
ncbi:MAG: NUDIX domain-containing protein [Chloroflexi bacterium]|nr:NUDIX domain-containing protein [Chloroflexota bacterium]